MVQSRDFDIGKLVWITSKLETRVHEVCSLMPNTPKWWFEVDMNFPMFSIMSKSKIDATFDHDRCLISNVSSSKYYPDGFTPTRWTNRAICKLIYSWSQIPLSRNRFSCFCCGGIAFNPIFHSDKDKNLENLVLFHSHTILHLEKPCWSLEKPYWFLPHTNFRSNLHQFVSIVEGLTDE